jgi:uroporphyrin-III C-methyltransferase
MISRLLEPGTVWLVGAGPGDPDLLTRKAWLLLQQADIVFHDALIGEDLLALIPGNVECVGVGKRSGRHSVPQDAINASLSKAARAGKRVVRLKGGDPSIFGRSAEEIEHLSAAGIPTFICPGVTTASAAAANAGGSLTLRGVARKLVLVTAHARAGEALDLDWSALADPKATLAVYMGRSAAGEISRQLIAHGLPRETPVLIATNVSRPDERLMRGELGALNFLVRAISDEAPTFLLIGEAAAARTCGAELREAVLC